MSTGLLTQDTKIFVGGLDDKTTKRKLIPNNIIYVKCLYDSHTFYIFIT